MCLFDFILMLKYYKKCQRLSQLHPIGFLGGKMSKIAVSQHNGLIECSAMMIIEFLQSSLLPLRIDLNQQIKYLTIRERIFTLLLKLLLLIARDKKKSFNFRSCQSKTLNLHQIFSYKKRLQTCSLGLLIWEARFLLKLKDLDRVNQWLI